MRIIAAFAAALLLLPACAQEQAEEPAPPAVAEESAPPAPAVTVADFVGTWNGTANLPGSAPVPTVITINADGSGTLLLPDRDANPMQLSIVGDSLVGVATEYESVLRPGVRVLTRTANVRSGATLSGSVVATYRTAAGDEVVVGTTELTRAP